MLRIRRIYDDALPVDREAIRQVQDILRAQFPLLSEGDVAKLPDQLRNPLKYGFRHVLFVAEGTAGKVKGFALLSHSPGLDFCYLDFMSAAPERTGGGIGGALYERLREEALYLGAGGLFLECLPDDPALCKGAGVLRQNAARLRFYERYGARPISNTAYETPLSGKDDCPPYLLYDPLGRERPLRLARSREIVRSILEQKYSHKCPRSYVDMVVASFRDDPVRIREPRYVRKPTPLRVPAVQAVDKRILLVVNERHEIHHVRDRGYVESPVRIGSILMGIEQTGLFERAAPHHFSESYIRAVHDGHMVDYFKKVCAGLPAGRSVYPYVFPIRNGARMPRELAVRAGYYCLDTFTPLNQNAYLAAKRAVDCALTVAMALTQGYRLGYGLVRPPGHHAERRAFGGFCYFNSAAVAANFLSEFGKVAVLDVDYHHGNGTQDIFYGRPDVLSVSIHGHPQIAYPYFSGFEEERGSGEGEGFNLNIPLPENTDGQRHRAALERALRRVSRFRPKFLIVALGLDTAKADPTGSWSLVAKDFLAMGRMIGALGLPTGVVQEGGYRVRSLGSNARHFFLGLWEGANPRAGLGLLPGPRDGSQAPLRRQR